MKKQLAFVPIVKIVGNLCNLRCSYCFYDKNRRCDMTTIMTTKVLDRFLKEYLDFSSDKPKIIWHGGEPLMAGLDFFMKIINLERKYSRPGQEVKNMIQTNGTLIDEKWSKFFLENKFHVGVSLDGNERMHNIHRHYLSGTGSFLSVMKGINELKKAGLTPGIIQTVTKENLEYFEKSFSFFVDELRIKGWSINLFDFLSANVSKKCNSLTNKDVSDLYKKCIDLWMKRGDKDLCIREVENLGAAVFKRLSSNCSFNGSCGRYFCLDYNGNIYPCDRFSSDANMLWGNILDTYLADVITGSKADTFRKKVHQLPDKCVQCNWKDNCNNGCTAMRNSEGIYTYCEARVTAFDYMSKKIQG